MSFDADEHRAASRERWEAAAAGLGAQRRRCCATLARPSRTGWSTRVAPQPASACSSSPPGSARPASSPPSWSRPAAR